MKFKVKDNFDDFMKRFNAFAQSFEPTMQDVMNTLLSDMCEEMKQEIDENRSQWEESGSALELLQLGDDIEYEIAGNHGFIYVGRNTNKIKMEDGRDVNPYLFIEFGWGIAGEQQPIQYSAQRRWEYNINAHDKAWVFMGYDNRPHKSIGRVGIDFFYRVVKKYRKIWKQRCVEAFKKNWY